MRHSEAPGVDLASLQLALSIKPFTATPYYGFAAKWLPLEAGFMHSATHHEALPLSAIRPLVERAAAECPRPPLAVSRLVGMRSWVVAEGLAGPITTTYPDKLRAEFGEEAVEAAMAVALGRPRPGHSVLGQGTFRAAEKVWLKLAERFVRSSGLATDCALFGEARYTTMQIHHLADTSPEGLAESGGAVAVLAPGPPRTDGSGC